MAYKRTMMTMTRRTAAGVCLFSLIIVMGAVVQALDNNYEIIEEEPMSINLIEKANAAFLCKSDGYFADVAYGCQFYHVCENANNPYDKPSFVKHTFSCVNGTVFNQMSFTCTRYDDSIPCESSPNYFYLNERNGNPKALFLTDEDIVVKPQPPAPAPAAVPSAHTSMQPFPFSHDDLIFSRHPKDSNNNNDHHHHHNSNLNNFKFKDFTETMNIMDMERSKNNRISSNHLATNSYDPVDDENIGMGEIYEINTVDHRAPAKSQPIQSFNHRPSSRTTPYDMSPKLSPFSPINDAMMKFPVGAKYEPATKINTYVPLNSNYERIATSRPSPGEKMIFGSSFDRFSSPKTEVRRPNEILKNTYVSYSDGPLNGETTAHSPVDATPAPTRKTTFTPAAFSRMYIESQKAAKLERMMQQPQFERGGFSPAARKPPLLKAFDHLKQEVIPIQNRTPPTPTYTAENINRNQPAEPPTGGPSKYDQLPDRFEQHINANQYVVPSSSPIRIIDPPQSLSTSSAPTNGRFNSNKYEANKDQTQIVPDQDDGRPIVEQPLKISFIGGENPNFGPVKHQSPQDDEQQPPGPFVDYGPGEYKVVKQVKGKNLLIDPSLENDPARDNIIAQVLEMLSKYN